jgi:hypothetical protein
MRLTPEILQAIFARVTRFRTRCLFAMALVCKGWNAAVVPVLFETLQIASLRSLKVSKDEARRRTQTH